MILIFGLSAIVVILAFKLRSKPRHVEMPPDLDRGRVLVKGLSEAELAKILSEFGELYQLAPRTFTHKCAGEEHREVSWTQPIATGHAQFLVNYLHYPRGFDLERASPCAVGVIPITPGTGPEGVSPGKLVKLYVPSDDTEYDVLYAALENGSTYVIPFTNHKWTKTTERRDNEFVRGMRFEVTTS
ncbi:MAG: hypothetical protein AAFZ11_15160 [Pseudomonadota bacterium]